MDAMGDDKTKYLLRVAVDEKLDKFLVGIGARADRGGSRWNRSAVIRRQFELYMAALDESDPRKRGFPADFYVALVELLTEPWSLNASLIRILDRYVEGLTYLNDHLKEAGIDREAFLTAIAQLTFAERLSIVEAAEAHHAPAASSGSTDL